MPMEKIKNQAHSYLHNILLGAAYIERYINKIPTVYMSRDILHTIECCTDAITNHRGGETTVCGYELRLAPGEKVLYIGYNIVKE